MKSIMRMTAVTVLGVLLFTGCDDKAANAKAAEKAKAAKAKKDRIEKEVVETELHKIHGLIDVYFADGTDSFFLATFKDYPHSESVDFSKYVYLPKKGGVYSSSREKVLVCEKPSPSKSSLSFVYESGQLGSIDGSFLTAAEVQATLDLRKTRKRNLKGIGSGIIMGFLSSEIPVFEGDFKQFRIHPRIDLSQYVLLPAKGDRFTGNPKIGLACGKIDPSQKRLAVVFGDGHVDYIMGSFSTVEQVKTAIKARK